MPKPLKLAFGSFKSSESIKSIAICSKLEIASDPSWYSFSDSYYGLAPHIHTKPIGGTEFIDVSLPENFSPDGDGLGIYTHCLNCGGDGTYEGIQLEVKAESKEG